MIDIAQDRGRWVLTLNRPDKANALTAEMLQALCDGVDAAQSEGAAALILTGAGKVFSAGADLDAARAGLATSPLWEALSSRIAAFPGVTVAALNGTVAGGAMGMVLACDLRVAVPATKFFYPVMKLGFLPQPSDPGRLAALVGVSRAKHLLLGGEKITMEQALTWGLVDIDSESEDAVKLAFSLTEAACAASADHREAIKRMIG